MCPWHPESLCLSFLFSKVKATPLGWGLTTKRLGKPLQHLGRWNFSVRKHRSILSSPRGPGAHMPPADPLSSTFSQCPHQNHLEMGLKDNQMQKHLQAFRGFFLGHRDDFGRLWNISQPGAVQGHITLAAGTGSEGPNLHYTHTIQKSLPRAAEHLKLCLSSLNMLLEERNHPAPVITPTPHTSQALRSFQWTTRYCSNMSCFSFLFFLPPTTKKHKLAHGYFYLLISFRFPFFGKSHQKNQKGQDCKGSLEWGETIHTRWFFWSSFSISGEGVAKLRSDLHCTGAVQQSMIHYWRSQPSSRWTNGCVKIAIT